MVATARRALEMSDLSQLVLNQLHQKPETREIEIGVAADHGIVTLTGCVKSKAERIAVESVAKQVSGVRAVANDLSIEPALDRTNTEIANDVLNAIGGHVFLAAEDIQVIVRDGCVTLEGNVHQELQKMLAEAQIKRLRGIFGISNQLQVNSEAPLRSELQSADNTPSNGASWIDTGEAEAG